jgi:diaminohydroxyphosphoribosylaminopyrimidine deaminase/5-amino-6-(5-phosphoribosylamino)uracil reductase
MTRGMPWVRSKIAASLDGRTALNNGESKWITGAPARQDVQHWRARSCAVLTGIGTVLADDPQLNVRGLETSRQPLRVVMDNDLRLPLQARLLQQTGLVVYTASQEEGKIVALEHKGARVVVLADANGQVDATAVLQDLAAHGCNEVLLEAGSKLNGALLKAGLVDELVLYLAPQMLGDMARGLARLGELTSLSQRIELEWQDVRHVGKDLRIVARVKK